jgi:hypothetical protein
MCVFLVHTTLCYQLALAAVSGSKQSFSCRQAPPQHHTFSANHHLFQHFVGALLVGDSSTATTCSISQFRATPLSRSVEDARVATTVHNCTIVLRKSSSGLPLLPQSIQLVCYAVRWGGAAAISGRISDVHAVAHEHMA